METLFALSDKDNVLYLNTFSRTISPAVRIGCMVLPNQLWLNKSTIQRYETGKITKIRNAETAEQETPKRQNMIRPNGGPCYAQTADKSKDNNLKENNPDIINPINQSGRTDEMEYITRIKDERSAYAQIVRDNTDYEYLIEQNPSKADTINELISIMVDAICSTRPTIRVNGEDVPHDVVKSTFLKLNSSHIEYVLEAMDNNTSDVRNIRSYLITALYNSRLTLNSYWQSRVNHDMKEYWQEG